MKKIKINYALTDAWESWYAEVPDDAPDDEEELLEWLGSNEPQFLAIEDSGNYFMEATEVEVLEQ